MQVRMSARLARRMVIYLPRNGRGPYMEGPLSCILPGIQVRPAGIPDSTGKRPGTSGIF